MTAIYLSTMAAGNSSITEFAGFAHKAGLAGIELSSSLPLSASEFMAVKQQILPGTHFLVHNYFPQPPEDFVLNLASSDSDILKKSRDHCMHAVRFCSAVASPFYSVHAGFAFNASPTDLGKPLTHLMRGNILQAKKVFAESLSLLCLQGQTSDVRILVENNVLAPFNLINGKNELLLGITAEDLLEIIAMVNMPNLGLLIDIGHLKVSARTLGFSADLFLKSLQANIEALHLSENDGIVDSNSQFAGNAWFLKHLENLNTEYLVLEINEEAISDISRMVSILKNNTNNKRKV